MHICMLLVLFYSYGVREACKPSTDMRTEGILCTEN